MKTAILPQNAIYGKNPIEADCGARDSAGPGGRVWLWKMIELPDRAWVYSMAIERVPAVAINRD
jgi:hypothetical protein